METWFCSSLKGLPKQVCPLNAGGCQGTDCKLRLKWVSLQITHCLRPRFLSGVSDALKHKTHLFILLSLGICDTAYADDTRLFLSFTPHVSALISACLADISTWMAAHQQKLNSNKTAFLSSQEMHPYVRFVWSCVSMDNLTICRCTWWDTHASFSFTISEGFVHFDPQRPLRCLFIPFQDWTTATLLFGWTHHFSVYNEGMNQASSLFRSLVSGQNCSYMPKQLVTSSLPTTTKHLI